MAVFDLYSKRQKALRGEIQDVFTYSEIPKKLRIQIVQIIDDAFGEDIRGESTIKEIYADFHKVLCKEFGVLILGGDRYISDKEKIFNHILNCQDIEEVLDAVELAFIILVGLIGQQYRENPYISCSLTPEAAISDLNTRFKENGVGYSFDGNQIIRVDSTYTHSEIIKPTINLLSKSLFLGANEEYLKAHEHYRHGLNKECITECAKAFESTMKIICTNKGWTFSSTDNASKLIQILMQNSLLPTTYQSQFSSLSNLLSSGSLTIRNKLGAHGQGAVPQTVDDNITRYALNLTGSSIIFLIELSGL